MQTQLPAQIKIVWRLRAMIDGLIWVILVVGLAVVKTLWLIHMPWWPMIVVLGLGILHVGSHLILIPYRYAFWRYQISSNDVVLKSGFIFRKTEAIPIARIQNVTLEQGPLLRGQHLQSVKVQTAATTHEIAGVEESVADALREQIMQLAKEARDDA